MISTYEIKLSTGAHFSLAWLVVLAQMVSNWCQNRKNHNFKRNKILQTIDFKGFAKKKSQKISTHLLTVLIMRAIVQIEQRKRDKESKI